MSLRIALFTLLFSVVCEAHDTIVHIGGIVALLNKSTSCERDLWGKSDENACRCCITKHSAKGDTNQKTFSYCKLKSHCTVETVQNIAAGANLVQNPVDPDAFVTAVALAANAIPTVTLNEDELVQPETKAGDLSNKTAVYFLKTAAEKGLISEYKDKLKRGEACLSAKKRNGGAQTLQLFSINLKTECNNNEGEKTIFILKEMKKPVEEVVNLEKIRNSDLSRYLPENEPKGIVLALSIHNLKYLFRTTSHYMSLLPTAGGMSMNNLLENFLEDKKTKKGPELEAAKRALIGKSCLSTTAIAGFHKDNMKPQNAIFGKTRVHGDLHLDNFFVGDQVWLIDDETMANSITNLQDVGQDLIRLYAHATSRFLGKSKLYDSFEPMEWKEVFLAPSLECYAKAYPADRLAEVKRELKKIVAGTGIYSLLVTQGVLYNPFRWSTMQGELTQIIDGIK